MCANSMYTVARNSCISGTLCNITVSISHFRDKLITLITRIDGGKTHSQWHLLYADNAWYVILNKLSCRFVYKFINVGDVRRCAVNVNQYDAKSQLFNSFQTCFSNLMDFQQLYLFIKSLSAVIIFVHKTFSK